MHDSQLEDRLRAVLRGEGEALPLTITPQELERRLSLRRRERTGRRAGLLAAGLAVVAVGSLLAASSGWFRAAPVGNVPETSSTPVAPIVEPTSAPSDAGLSCTTIEPDEADQPPTVVLGTFPGDTIPYFGGLGAFRLGNRGDGDPFTWIDPASARLEPVPGSPPTERLEAFARLSIDAQGSPTFACLDRLIVDAVPIDAIDAPALPVADMTIIPTRTVAFDVLPVGDWLVRVHAEFATTSDKPAWSETFFRVVVHDTSAGAGTVLPALPYLSTPPQTILVDAHGDTERPAEPTGATKEWVPGRVPPRGLYIVDVVCLGSSPIRWSIGHEGEFGFLVAGDQACDGTVGTLGLEYGIPTDALDVVVQGDPATAWHLRVATNTDEPAFIPPALRMRVQGDPEGPDGATEAFGRCVSRATGSDPCAGEWLVLEGARPLVARTGAVLTIALQDDWAIERARLTAAVADEVRTKPFAPEYSVGFVDPGGSEITVPVDLGRGTWIVRVSLNAHKGGESFGAYYDLPLVIDE